MPTKCITDSKSLHDAVYSSKEITEKRLKIELCKIRESLEKGEIETVIWVNSKDQQADCVTKEGASREKLYEEILENLNSILLTSYGSTVSCATSDSCHG